MNDTLRVGFVGLGSICRQRHVPGLKRIPGVEIVAVANRSRASSERAAAEFGIPEICEDWRELVARPDLQAVFIGTWPYMHREVALAALDAGKHVFCQARMAMNAAEALDMVRRARALDLVAALCPVPFGLKYDRAMARMLREGELGEIRLVQAASLSGAYADPETPMNWRKDHRLSGLNMHTLGMYVEVMHRWFGWTAEVSAQTQTFTPERVDETGAHVEVRIPDQILLAARQRNGIPIQYAFSTVARHPVDRVEVYGSEATLRYDVASDAMTVARAGETAFSEVEVRPDEAYDVAQWRVEEDFVAAIREGRPYHPDFEDGVRYMQVVDAVYTSASSGKVVPIAEPV